MEAKNKKINVVWCDDNIDHLVNPTTRETFEDHHCYIYKTAKTSEQLKTILVTCGNFIDAVIVDFNMGDTNEFPDKETASGFRWIHDNIHHYPLMPFYLGSSRDRTFIEEKYRDYDLTIDGDYFLSKNPYVSGERNRLFKIDEFDEMEAMLNMIEEEVEVRRSPTFRIRQEFSEAFDAIDKFGLNGDVFIKILNYDKNQSFAEIVITSANSIRTIIEKLMSRFNREGIIPNDTTLNDIPNLFSGRDTFDKKQGFKNSDRFAHDDLMPIALHTAFKQLLIDYTQDGSHDNDKLTIHFRNYLEKTGDIYIVKSLAIICLDFIKWASSFYEKYKLLKPFAFQPFEAQIEEMISDNGHGKEGGIVHYNNKTFFVKQHPSEAKQFKKGTRVLIEEMQPYTAKPKEYDYYCGKFIIVHK